MESFNEEKPRLLTTGAGFCVLNTVEYKNRFLYSKYNPSRSILGAVEKLTVLPGTLVLICSPVLWYGLEELFAKLPEHCHVLAVEADLNLYELAENQLKGFPQLSDKVKLFSYSVIHKNGISQLDSYVRELVNTGNIRRVLKVDFSAGVQFYSEEYNFTASALQDIITVFWKNRITLQKMGRLYSKNILRNISALKNNPELNFYKKSVNKNILVCGAGESLDAFNDWNTVKNNYFVISVDAATKALCKRGIIPDAIVTLEGQFAIQNSYIGLKKYFSEKEPVLFADLCSRNEVLNLFTKKVLFLSEFTDCKYIKNLQENKIISSIIPPLGSVGLAAVYIALLLRNSPDNEIFTVGLDFAYSAGKTHAKQTQASLFRLFSSGRLISHGNFDACFGSASIPLTDKNNSICYSGQALSSYAVQFANEFSREKNLYDCGTFGIDLRIPFKKIKEVKTNSESNINFDIKKASLDELKIQKFYETEKQSLLTALSLLKEGDSSQYRTLNKSLEEQIRELLEPRDYLYLHFPDGQKYSPHPSFLKRVRAELDFFIKQIELGLKN